MGPAELAALVAREADTGLAAALTAWDAPGVLAVDTVVGRIGSRPAGTDVVWDDVVWQAEFHLRPTSRIAPGTDPDHPAGSVPEAVAMLPVGAVRGVGAAWAARFTRLGAPTVGALAGASPVTVSSWVAAHGPTAAQLVGRARTATGPWPEVAGGDRRTVLDVVRTDPGPDPAEIALWGHCLRLLAALDDSVLARLPVAVNAR